MFKPGLFGANLQYHAPLITLNEIQFVGSLVGNQSDFLGIMKLADDGKVKTHDYKDYEVRRSERSYR